MLKAFASGGSGNRRGETTTGVTDTQLLKRISENNRGKTRGSVIGRVSREEVVNRLFGNSSRTTKQQSSRTWNTRFAFNGSQISSDGKYQINRVRNGYSERYELVQLSGGRSKRVGVYNSVDSAKNHAK